MLTGSALYAAATYFGKSGGQETSQPVTYSNNNKGLLQQCIRKKLSGGLGLN